MAITRTETTQADWQAGTLTNVVATAGGDLQINISGAPTFTRSSVAYKSDGTQVAAGVPRFETGEFGQAVMVEEGTTNVVADPSFENADITLNWNAASVNDWAYTGTARVRDTTYKKYGSASAKCGDGANNGKGIAEKNQGASAHAVASGQTWILSFDVYATNAATKYIALIRCYDSTGANISGSITPPMGWAYTSAYQALFFTDTPPGANAWYRVSKAFTVPSGVVYVAISLQYYTGGDYYVWFDGIQFEQKPYATSFIDSSRSAELLTIPTSGVLSAQEGTVECWIKLSRAPETNNQTILDAGGTSTNGHIFYVGTDGKLVLQVGTGSSVAQAKGTTVIQPNVWYHVAVRWSSSGIAVFVNGALENSVSTTPNIIFNSSAYIGSNGGSLRWLDGLIDDLRISGRARTDTEISTGYSSGSPLPVDRDTTYKLNFDGSLAQGEGGYRISPSLDLSSGASATSSQISWTATAPTNTTIVIETSLDGGATWQSATNGGAIPGITAGMSLSGKSLLVRQTLTTSDPSVTPTLSDLTVTIGALYTAFASAQASGAMTGSARRFVFAVASASTVSAMDWNEHIQAVSATAMAGATVDVAAIRLLIQTLMVNAVIQPGDIVEIDTARMTVKVNGVNALQFVEGDFFSLLPGENHLEYQDSETQRNVQIITRHRPRWL